MRRALSALLLLCAVAAHAAVPQRLNYQGKLGNAAGDPLSGTYSFRFKLFAAETGGAALFSEDVTGGDAVSVVNGIYTVQIGSFTVGGIPYGVFNGPDLYLEVDVNAGATLTGAETLTPRERLNSAAWAVHALGAERLGTGAVIATFTATGQMTFPGPVTITGSSLTVIHGGNTQPFILAATSATDRSSYHLYVATTGTVAMGRAAGATAGSRLDVAGPAFIGAGAGDLFLGGGGWPYSIGVGWAGQDSILRFNAVGTNGGTADFRDFYVYDGKTNLIAAFDGSTARFGIGTNAPIADLDVHKPAGSYPRMTLSDGNATLPDYSGSQSVGEVSLTNAVGHLKSNRGSNGTNTDGGILFQGFTAAGVNDWNPMHLVGTHGGTAPTAAAVTVSGQKHSGTDNRAALAGAEPVFDVETNYKGTLLLRVQGDGRVGISTSSPQTKLEVSGDASFGSGATKSTFTATPGNTVYALQTSSGINVGGTGGVVAAFFSGSGAALTGITASDNTKVAKAGDNMTGQLTIKSSSLTVIGAAGENFSLAVTTAADRSVYHLYVTTYGNVGVGTTDPWGSLTVKSNDSVPSAASIVTYNPGTSAGSWNGIELSNNLGAGWLWLGSSNYGASPTAIGRSQLVVESGGNVPRGIGLSALGGGDVRFYTTDNGVERFTVKNAGNVGISTGNPTTLLDVNGNAQFGSGATKSTFTATPGNTVYALQTSSGINVGGTGGVVAAFFSGSGAALTGITASDNTKVAKAGDNMTGQLTIKSSSLTVIGAAGENFSLAVTTAADRSVYHLLVATYGHVGIGTSNPGNKLSVAEPDSSVRISLTNTRSTANRWPGLTITNYMGTAGTGGGPELELVNARGDAAAPGAVLSGDGLGYVSYDGHDGTSTGQSALVGALATENWTTGAHGARLYFATTPNGSTAWPVTRMTVAHNGNVGIGTTSPTARLHVSSANAATSDTIFLVSSGTAASQEILVVKGDGNVGVGTTAPARPLQVNNTTTNHEGIAILRAYNTTQGAAIGFWPTGGNSPTNVAWLSGLEKDTNDYRISAWDGTSFLRPMTLSNTGNVGIGTTTPSYALDIYSTAANSPTLRLNSGDNGSSDPRLLLFHSRAGGALNAWDGVGRILFRGMNSASEDYVFGGIYGFAASPTNASEMGAFYIDIAGGGVQNRNQIYFDGYGATFNNNRYAADFQVNSNLGSALSILGASGYVGVSTGVPQATLDVNGNAQFGAGATKSTFTATPGNTVYALQTSSGINVAGTGGVVADFFEGDHVGDGSRLTNLPGALPAGLIALSTTTCPTGYQELLSFAGRFPLGLPSGGTIAGTVGTPLTNLADMTHTHSFTPAGTNNAPAFTGTGGTTGAEAGHTHAFTPAGTLGTPSATACTMTTANASCGTSQATSVHVHTFTGTGDTTGAGASHSHSFTPAGTVAAPTFSGTGGTTGSGTTTPPYIQVRFCMKN